MFEPSQRRGRLIAARMAGASLAAGLLWIAVTDTLLMWLVDDRELLARLNLLKGWGFMFIAATIVYVMARAQLGRLLRSEATTRAIVDSMADGVLLVGRDGRIVDCNPAALRILEIPDKRTLFGMNAVDFSRRFHWSYPDGRLVPPGEYISQRALRGEQVRRYTGILFVDSGKSRTISSTAAPVRLSPGSRPEFSVSVMRDITELEALDRLRDDFFAAAAHSLKTPATIIRMHAQLLARRVEDERARQSAEAIDRQCGQIDRLVQNLLVLARLRAGTIRFHPDQVDLRELAAHASEKMRGATRYHALRERFDAQATVIADPERLSLAVENLIDWAFTISPPYAAVTLSLEQHDGSARLGVTYLPWPHSEEGHALFAGLNVGRHVSEELVRANGAKLSCESWGNERTDWIELPIVERRRDATA